MKVDVLMAVRGNGEHLVKAMDSLLGQTYKNLRVIVVDDSCDRECKRILSGYGKHKKIRIVVNKSRLGLTKSLNKAIGYSNAKLIARMDADDISYPERIEKQVRYLTENPGVGLIGCQANLIDEGGAKIGETELPEKTGEIKKIIYKRNPIIHSSWLVRREVVEKVGRYDEFFRYAQDYEWLLRATKRFNLENMGERLLDYRRTKQQFRPLYYYKQQAYAVLARLKNI